MHEHLPSLRPTPGESKNNLLLRGAEYCKRYLQRRQSPQAPHLIHGKHAVSDQDVLDLRLLHLASRRVHIGKTNSRSCQPNFLLIASRVRCSAKSWPSARWPAETPGRSFRLPWSGSRLSPAQGLRGQVESVRNDPQQKFLPLQAQVGVGAAAKPQHFRFVFHRENRALGQCLRSHPATTGSIARDAQGLDPEPKRILHH